MKRTLLGPALALVMAALPIAAIAAVPAQAATSTLRALAEAQGRYFGTALTAAT